MTVKQLKEFLKITNLYGKNLDEIDFYECQIASKSGTTDYCLTTETYLFTEDFIADDKYDKCKVDRLNVFESSRTVEIVLK